jgi:hypothetical protein
LHEVIGVFAEAASEGCSFGGVAGICPGCSPKKRNIMTKRNTTKIAAAAVAGALALVSLAQATAQAAPSSTTGLYGASDPTYDGVFRQSLAIIGLTSVGVKPSAPAIDWLLNQQCANGSYQAYRADLAAPCAPSDPATSTGPDTNSTAAALAALMSIDDANAAPATALGKVTDAASKAGLWLAKQQLKDGGWPYFPGGTSDANSTGLALAGVMTQAPNFEVPAYVAGSKFLAGLVAPCGSAVGGGVSYQKGAKPDAAASSQALLGLNVAFPVSSPRKLADSPTCSGTTGRKIASYLSSRIQAKGALDSSFGSGPDYTSTASTVLAFVAAGYGKPAVAKATTTLAANARTFTKKDGGAVPAALGLLIMVSEATGKNPRSFGGINLITALQGSQR